MSPTGKRAILLIHGNQRLLVEDELKKVREKISEDVDLSFNLDVFEAGEDSLEDALQAADTLPLASDRRYVIIKEAQKLGAPDIKRLKSYVEDPAESSLLILTAVGLKAGSPLIRLMEKGGRVKEVSKRRDQIPGWIRSRFKERGLKVSGKAIAYLQDALGEDLMAIEAAVEKIGIFHDGEDEVDLDEVVPLVAPTAERSIYELVDRVALGDSDQAVKLLRRLMQQGEKPTYILYALARRFRELLLYHALREDGRQAGEIAAYMKLPKNQSWMVTKKLKPQATRLNEEGLRKALSLLVRVDWAIKSGEMDDEFAAEVAVSSLSKLTARPLSRGQIHM
jgi:DNA polymerase III subunit delta